MPSVNAHQNLSSPPLPSPVLSRDVTIFRDLFFSLRQEQELYISELEGKNKIPEGKEVVHPLPGFVIKAKFTKGSKDAVPEKVTSHHITSHE